MTQPKLYYGAECPRIAKPQWFSEVSAGCLAQRWGGHGTESLLSRMAVEAVGEQFFTHRDLSSNSLNEVTLSPDEYKQIGENVLMRILALGGRIR